MAIISEIIFYFVVALSLFIAFFFLLTYIEVSRRKKTKQELIDFKEVTFLIPALNVEKYIGKCLTSILKQDYPQNKIKIWVVDNGSTDKTLEIIKSFMKKHKNIEILHRKHEHELSKLKTESLNFGIKKIRTELTACLDADTYPQPDAMKQAVLELENPKTMLVTFRLVPTKSNFLSVVQDIEYAFCVFFRKLLASIEILAFSNAFTVYKTKFFREYGDFDVGNITEDFEIALRAQSNHHNVACVTETYAETVVPETLKALQRQRIRWNYGLVYNLYKYKRLFSMKYGDLGLFSLASQLLMVLATMIVLIFALSDVTTSAINTIRQVSLGLYPELNMSVFNITLFLSQPKIILYIISIIFSLFFFSLVRKYMKKKLNFAAYLFYTFIYVWFTVYLWVITVPWFFTRKPEW